MVGSQAAAFCYVNLTRSGACDQSAGPVSGAAGARLNLGMHHVGHLGHLTVCGQLLGLVLRVSVEYQVSLSCKTRC